MLPTSIRLEAYFSMEKEHFDYIRETLTWFFGQGIVVTPKENGQAGTGDVNDKKASENGSAVY